PRATFRGQRPTVTATALDSTTRHIGGPRAGTSRRQPERSTRMSTSTVETPGNTAGPTISRDRVTWRDIIAVGWRQHRSMLLGTGAIVLLGAALMTLISSLLVDHGNVDSTLPLLFDMGIAQATEALTICITGYSAVVAVFWAAPLLAKEYEQRTHLFAWGQDVSPLRWLAGKTLLLASVAVSFAVLLGA